MELLQGFLAVIYDLSLKAFFCEIESNQLCNVVVIVNNEDFLFCSHGFSSFLFLEFYNGHAGIAFSEFAETEGSYVLLALQVIVDTFAEGTGTFSVNDTDGFQCVAI